MDELTKVVKMYRLEGAFHNFSKRVLKLVHYSSQQIRVVYDSDFEKQVDKKPVVNSVTGEQLANAHPPCEINFR